MMDFLRDLALKVLTTIIVLFIVIVALVLFIAWLKSKIVVEIHNVGFWDWLRSVVGS